MNAKNSIEIIKEINNLKLNSDYSHLKVKELRNLPSYNGIAEFKFKEF